MYFVLDLLSGGDLRYQLGRHPRKYFSEAQTKFFIACIVESLIYIHSQNIIHRDIKPENLIFDEKGYLHVTDFGIAKFLSSNNLNETSGTPGYMAPEVMRGLNHTGSVDYFAVGVIAYELMLGKRPYYGKNRKEIKEQMMIKQVFLDEDNIPVGWSQYAADFINRLLLRKDVNRLGYFNDLEVKRHPWLSDINFEDLVNYKIVAPFIPKKNNDNYDKKYCEEIEEIGIDTNIRYEEFRNNKRYSEIFEGFTFYNVDESQLIQYQEIYKKPSVKYTKNNLNLNLNNSNTSYFRKSRTINVDFDYKRSSRISQDLSQKKIDLTLKHPPNIRTKNNSISIPNNGNNPTIRRMRSQDLKIKYNNIPRNSIINNSRFSLKNGEDEFFIASPINSGRRTINNDNTLENNNTYKNYGNHSFLETNYIKGKVIHRSNSSSNISNNSNYVNIFNLLVNNVNNINNHNGINNNDSTMDKYQNNNSNCSKISTPISYNKINKPRIPLDKKTNSNYKNYNNLSCNNNNNNSYSYQNRSFVEKPKNRSFCYIDNNNISLNYNYNRRDLRSMFNESMEEDSKNYNYNYKNKSNTLKRAHSNYYIKQKIPHGSIRKIIPINLKEKDIPNKSNTINIDYYDKKPKSINYNKIQTIDYINAKDFSNNSFYIDKYENNGLVLDGNGNKFRNSASQKDVNRIYGYNILECNRHKHSNSLIIGEKNINRREAKININNCNNNSNSSSYANSYNNININNTNNNINSMNNTYCTSNSRNNRSINKSSNLNNNINKVSIRNDKSTSYKKIPIPSPLSKKILRKKIVEYNIANNSNSNLSTKMNCVNSSNLMNNSTLNNTSLNSKVSIINNNYINNSTLNNNNCKCTCYNYINNKDDIKSNNMYDKYKTSLKNDKSKIPYNNSINNKRQYYFDYSCTSNKKPKNDIISMKINEKTFCQYQYLENFDKYKKIKNNKNNTIKNDTNEKNNNHNLIRKKISEKYHTYESKEKKNKKANEQKGDLIKYYIGQAKIVNKNINYNQKYK